jgi:3-phosphoshikimate 1-carboxyvinyltransferase
MKQSIRMASTPIHAHIAIPGSKNMTYRALLLAALAEGVSELFDVLINDDTLIFIEALRSLGIVVQTDVTSRTCIVAGNSGQFPKKAAMVSCQDSGTTARFLLAVCAGTGGTYHFNAGAQLSERPIHALLKILSNQGAKIAPEDAHRMPLTLTGAQGLSGGVVEIEGNEMNQTVYALLMAAPYAKHEMILKTQSDVSNSVIEMTCELMADFGVLVRRMHNARYSIPAPQRYGARDYVVEPDLSIASYFFAAAAVTGGEIRIQPISRSASRQADVAFLTVLEKMGCEVQESVTGLTVRGPAGLSGVSVDMSHFSDTFMTLAALAPFADSPTTITNIGHTRTQASNRISIMRKELEALGVTVEEGPDWIRIFPGLPHGGVVDSHNDYRIAMAFSIIGLKVPGIEIEGAECVSTCCPDFYDWWRGLSS